MKIIKFTFGGNLVMETNEGLEREVEIGPFLYRAKYDQDARGNVMCLQIERDETRHGKPEIWRLDSAVPQEVRHALVEQIEDEDAREQARIVEMYDAERA